MRYLPLVLVAFMIAPIAIWVIVAHSLPGTTTTFNDEQAYLLYTLVPLMIVAFGLLSRWSMRFICQTRGC